MGVVYLAARADDQYRKRVAIKVIPVGGTSHDAIRHFRRERQILASLEHPNIARLLDGGTTADGAPYIVMEFVEGEAIDRYCHRRELALADRLRMFLVVCGAVAYAHRNLVVHRDLKPRNILVSGDGVPKLLDFGIATFLNPDLAGETAGPAAAFTAQYASPEQVQSLPVTTAADVYSLGVVLDELLTHRARTGSRRTHRRRSTGRCASSSPTCRVRRFNVTPERARTPTHRRPLAATARSSGCSAG